MKCRDAEAALRNLGFEFEKQEGSHQKWRLLRDGRLRKVTLDCHKGEVRESDVRSMIGQAGVTKREWYEAASGLNKST